MTGFQLIPAHAEDSWVGIVTRRRTCPALAEALHGRGTGLQVLNLGVWTPHPMAFTVMAAWAELEPEVARRRTADWVAKRRAAGKDLSGRLRRC